MKHTTYREPDFTDNEYHSEATMASQLLASIESTLGARDIHIRPVVQSVYTLYFEIGDRPHVDYPG